MKKSKGFLTDGRLSLIIILAILIIDQYIKIMVKTNMCLGESIHITNWFQIHFIENSGMAYGMEFINKIVLSLFRIAASCYIGWIIYQQVKLKARTGYIVCLSMVLAGAAGNVFDGMFYGLIFNGSSPDYISYFVPLGHGYAPFLMGKVVDMFYFPIIDTNWPSWMPVVGGDHFIFFSPIFNFADSCISVGVVVLLIFYRKELAILFSSKPKTKPEE